MSMCTSVSVATRNSSVHELTSWNKVFLLSTDLSGGHWQVGEGCVVQRCLDVIQGAANKRNHGTWASEQYGVQENVNDFYAGTLDTFTFLPFPCQALKYLSFYFSFLSFSFPFSWLFFSPLLFHMWGTPSIKLCRLWYTYSIDLKHFDSTGEGFRCVVVCYMWLTVTKYRAHLRNILKMHCVV